MKRFLTILLFLVALTGCPGGAVISEAQQWKDLTFRVETRPPIVKPGMIEFLVLANRGERKRAHDLIVSIRIGESGKWRQAIQDGHVGVYRRALRVSNPDTEKLYVHVKHADEEKVLIFPLNFAKRDA